MLKISAFKLGTIQDCMHILNECELEGITDIRFVRQRLADHIHDVGIESVKSMRKGKVRRQTKTIPCPECGSPISQAVDENGEKILVDGLPILACKKCRWSAVADKYKTAGKI